MAKVNLQKQSALTQARLKALLNYDPETGDFTYAVSRLHGRCAVVAGDVAGKLNPNGYRYINLDGNAYLAHRLAFFYMTGRWPPHEVDHRNGVRSDNSWSNLREATALQNRQNLPKRRRRRHPSWPTGAKQVSTGRWSAAIRADNKNLHLGTFDTADEAHAAYLAAKANLHTFNPTVRAVEPAIEAHELRG